jgi:hypothetical protein
VFSDTLIWSLPLDGDLQKQGLASRSECANLGAGGTAVLGPVRLSSSCNRDDGRWAIQIDVPKAGRPRWGSKRAATGVRNDRGARLQIVEDHDRRFHNRRPLTWRFSRLFPVLNITEFHGETPNADLARRKPGVQIPSPPPPTSQVRASPARRWRRSLQAAAAPRPHAQVAVQPRRLAATR